MEQLRLEELATSIEVSISRADLPLAWKADLTQDCILELVQRQEEPGIEEEAVQRIIQKHIKRWKRTAERNTDMYEELMYCQAKEQKKLELEEAITIMHAGVAAYTEINPKALDCLILREAHGFKWRDVAKMCKLSAFRAREGHEKAIQWMKQWMVRNGVESIKELI